MAKIDDMYTIQQLASICECSIPVARKYVLRAKYKESTIHTNGRATKAYNIPLAALQTMKDRIQDNKSKIAIYKKATENTIEVPLKNTSSSNVLEAFENNITSKAQEYWQLYITTKEELLNIQSNVKLIEDKAQSKEALYLKEIEDLKTDKERLQEENTKVTAAKQRFYQAWLITLGVLIFCAGVALCYLVFVK